jgi:glycosyltransferase involved in cell wall biosynthesis
VGERLDTLSVSVLLPVYFKKAGVEEIRLLRRALDSVSVQTFPAQHEVILVDDGSPTPIKNLDFVNEAHRKIRILRSERNQGLAHALNRGLVAARFPLIARLDADDRWRPGKLEKQLRLFEADPDLTINATGMTLITPQEQEIELHIRKGDWIGVLKFCSELGCPLPHGSVVARREIYRLLGGYPQDPTFTHCEDYALWSVWLRFFKANMIEQALYDYTVSAGSVSVVYAQQQATASHSVNQRFRALGLVGRLPGALAELSSIIRGSILDAGILAYRIWRFRLCVRLPPEALGPLRTILPDRRLLIEKSGVRPFPLDRVIGTCASQPDGQLVAIRAL